MIWATLDQYGILHLTTEDTDRGDRWALEQRGAAAHTCDVDHQGDSPCRRCPQCIAATVLSGVGVG